MQFTADGVRRRRSPKGNVRGGLKEFLHRITWIKPKQDYDKAQEVRPAHVPPATCLFRLDARLDQGWLGLARLAVLQTEIVEVVVGYIPKLGGQTPCELVAGQSQPDKVVVAQETQPAGISPDSLFSRSHRFSNFPSLPNEAGIDPLSMFP